METTAAQPEAPRVAGFAVQVGSFADSAHAADAAAALTKLGFAPDLSRAEVNGAVRWRVLVAPSPDREVAGVVAANLVRQHREAVVIPTPVSPRSVRMVMVNGGSHGMASRPRWTLSQGGDAMAVMEDPAAVEAEPVPNGVVLASESQRALVQVDSVWDASPSPAWRSLLVGRAYTITQERDTATPAQWASLARAAGTTPANAQAHAFASSGMSMSFALARAGIVDLPDTAGSVITTSINATPHWVGPLAGWRVAWSSDGSALLLGDGAARAQDDADARRWRAVHLDGTAVSAMPKRATLAWTTGPTLDMSIPIALDSAVRIGAHVVGVNGWIIRDGRIIGAGRPLAATRDALFIAALAPNTSGSREEPNSRLVVYVIAP